MARPRRATIEVWYDIFSDMPIDDQAAALKILEQVHRLAVREAKRSSTQQPAEPSLLLESGGNEQ